MYMLPRLITCNAYVQFFQCKILNKILFANKKLHTFGKKPSPLCSSCNLRGKAPFHTFHECDHVECLWSDLVQCFQNNLISPPLTLQTASFGIHDSTSDDSIIKNNKVFISHLLLIFKLHVYKSQEKKFINLNNLIGEIQKVKQTKKIVLNNSMKTIAFTKKWHVINNIIA